MMSGLKGKKVLVTGGPTSVAIDDMRVLTNRSTGEMGRLLANACVRGGAKVVLLEGAVTTTAPLSSKITVKKFFFLDELVGLFSAGLKAQPDIVIHAAAVSDFEPKKSFKGKLSSGDKLSIHLVPTRKLIAGVKKIAPETLLVGFKFESSLSRAVEEGRRLFLTAGCDLVVANSQRSGKYQARLLCCDGMSRKIFNNKPDVVRHLIQQVEL